MAQRTFYGRVALVREYCTLCKGWTIVENGELQCCNNDAGEVTDVRRASETRRVRRTLGATYRRRLSKRQGGRCYWCSREFNSFIRWKGKLTQLECTVDHIIPFVCAVDSLAAVEDPRNLCASCSVCNYTKGKRVFNSVEETRAHVLKRWRRYAREASGEPLARGSFGAEGADDTLR